MRIIGSQKKMTPTAHGNAEEIDVPQTEGEVVRNFVEIAARGGPRHRRGQHRAERDGVDADRQVDDAVHVVERRNRFRAEADRQRAVDEEADLQRGSADHAGQHKPPEPPENAAFAEGFARHGRKPSAFRAAAA